MDRLRAVALVFHAWHITKKGRLVHQMDTRDRRTGACQYESPRGGTGADHVCCGSLGIRAAKAAVDKECEKLEKISEWNLTKVRCKKEVIDEARTSGAKVHFASLMDLCHLKNAELEAKHQKYKGRVVLRGDIVKDDSGSYAIFTEQGSSAS